jgi:outer membrane protein OmpA-like peptidoglycan-associated protein
VSAILKQTIGRILKNKLTIIIGALIILYSAAGFFLLPYLIQRYIPEMLKKRLGVEASLQEVKINPFAMTLEVKGFQMKESSGSALAGFQRLYVNFQASSLFRWAYTFDEVTIDGLSVNVVIEPDGKLNFAKLTGSSKTAPTPENKKSKLIRLLLQAFNLNQGRIDITDKRQTIPATESLTPLNIKLTNISTLPNREGPYTLTARSPDGTTLQWSGDVSLQPVHSEGVVKFEQIPLSTPWKFFRSYLNITQPEGHLSMETHYLIDLGEKKTTVNLDNLGIGLAGLSLQLEGAEKPFLKLQDVRLDVGKLDLMQHKVDALRFEIKGGGVDAIMDKDGIFNMQRIMALASSPNPAPASSSTATSQQAPWAVNVSDVKLEGISIDYNDQSNKPPVLFSTKEVGVGFKADINTGAPSMQVKVNDFGLTLKQIALGFKDAAEPVVQIGSLAISGGAVDLGARSASIAALELTDGSVDVVRRKDGTVNLMQLYNKDAGKTPTSKNTQAEKNEPWSYVLEKVAVSEFRTNYTDATVRPDKPLIGLEKIALNASHIDGKSPIAYDAHLSVAQGGDLKASGMIDPATSAVKSDITVKDLSMPIAQPYLALQTADLTLNSGLFSTQGTFDRTTSGAMTYKGMVRIAKMQIMENGTKDTLLGWGELRTNDMRLGINPNGLVIDNLKLTGLESKFIISEDKKVNIVEAFKGKGSEPAESKTAAPVPEVPGNTFPVKVSRLNMENGNLSFADLSLRPQFATKMHELKGVVIGISSTAGARTQVELDGRVDEFGTSKITGEMNSFDPTQFTDITMAFRNLEMTNFTPYSGKFAGRKIDSGRLSLDLQYKIQNKQLDAKNKLVIEKLKLGEKVESPDAIHLPLDLAIAILKDSNGVIDLDLPVTGDLNDPNFHYGRIVWKAIVNVLTKLVTAPFRALGALFGSKEELLDSVTFDAGSKNIPPPEQEKLLKLLDVLQKRPQLKLTVTGRYSSDTDTQALKDLQVRRAVAEASSMKLEPGENPGPVDYSSADSQKRLSEIYISRYGQEAYDAIGAQLTPKENPSDTKSKKGETLPAVEDPGELSKLIYADLVKREQVDPAVLKQLADDRAQAIAAKLSGSGLPQERVGIKPSEAAKHGDALTSVLGLDAM